MEPSSGNIQIAGHNPGPWGREDFTSTRIVEYAALGPTPNFLYVRMRAEVIPRKAASEQRGSAQLDAQVDVGVPICWHQATHAALHSVSIQVVFSSASAFIISWESLMNRLELLFVYHSHSLLPHPVIPY